MSELINIYHKGSEWRRWDLHIHTPGTKKNDRFEGTTLKEKWDNYVNRINEYPDPIAAIGVTDYFCTENYFKFKKLIEDGEITKQFDLVLPNVELRITPVAVSSPVNIHCIFNPDIDDQIEDRFLSKLSFSHGGTTYNSSRQSLIRLGRARKDNSSLSELEALKAGIEVFVISPDSIRSVFEKDPDLKTNTIIVVSNRDGDGVSGIVKHENYFTREGSQLDAVRESIYQLSDAIFSSNKGDREYFLGLKSDDKATVIKKAGSLKPCFHGCDAHSLDQVFKPADNRNCWIKSDPTFEGLKQVLYEPEDRVQIQPNSPESKTGYQVIDRIEIGEDSILNSELSLNPNLNSIIGGRSSGKSILLGSIANKVKSTRPVSYPDQSYQEYVKTISKTIKVIWKDGKEDNEREIEFFEQGYMHDIARNKSKLYSIIKGILNQKGKETYLNEYSKFLTENSKSISGLISDYYRLLIDIFEKQQKARDKGDRAGIEKEIEKLTEEQKQLSKTTISEKEKEFYEKTKAEISTKSQTIQSVETDDSIIQQLRATVIFKDNIDYELTSLSSDRKDQISEVFENLKSEVSRRWVKELDAISTESKEQKNVINKEIEVLQAQPIYVKVKKAYQENEQLTEYEEKIKVQNQKLFEIKSLYDDVGDLSKQIKTVKERIKTQHKLFFDKIEEIIPKLNDSQDGLDIKARFNFEEQKYKEILSSGLNLQGFDNQKLLNFEYTNFASFEERQFEIFEKLSKNELTLKGGYDSQKLSSSLLSSNFFDLTYDLEYEGDDFAKMSDGKKAFVVLKLLLDFNDKDCPILIDQPEDDLDNRAIYKDLVQYLRKKKEKRQIILATHNPNIVVGADSELIACANQHGEKSTNRDDKKFQYVTGSLEHTVGKDGSNNIILESQGTREHVCEVLEGGNTAFKLREKKYSIKE